MALNVAVSRATEGRCSENDIRILSFCERPTKRAILLPTITFDTNYKNSQYVEESVAKGDNQKEAYDLHARGRDR